MLLLVNEIYKLLLVYRFRSWRGALWLRWDTELQTSGVNLFRLWRSLFDRSPIDHSSICAVNWEWMTRDRVVTMYGTPYYVVCTLCSETKRECLVFQIKSQRHECMSKPTSPRPSRNRSCCSHSSCKDLWNTNPCTTLHLRQPLWEA
jgi:hypothetical protein